MTTYALVLPVIYVCARWIYLSSCQQLQAIPLKVKSDPTPRRPKRTF